MSFDHMGAWGAMSSLRRGKVTQDVPRGTWRRVFRFARPYRRQLVAFLVVITGSALIGVVTPVLAGRVVNQITSQAHTGTVIRIAVLIAGLAVVDAGLSFTQRWFSARIGEGLIFDMRTAVFDHVQRMPLAFFTRTQTGALVSRLNNDVLGAQQAFTSTLSGLVSNIVALVLTAAVMFSLSWQITALSLVMLPLFVIPARRIGRRLQTITRESYNLNASMNNTMTERFNVAGALLVKLFGTPRARGRVVPSPGRPGPGHRRHLGHVRARLLRLAHAGRGPGAGAGVRARRATSRSRAACRPARSSPWPCC